MNPKLMVAILSFFMVLTACAEAKDLEGRVERSLAVLNEARFFESRFFGEAGRISEHHKAFEILMKSKDAVTHFNSLASSKAGDVARAYGLLGLWRLDKGRFQKKLNKLKGEKKIPCMYTFGPADVSMKRLFEDPKKTWSVFLFNKKLD